ncbi:MAG: PIN/TRAM domain-containing protein [Phycisphaerae bacterium]|nr:PIN/TRAM domain-containing protein [Phycisphaerae bacterium]
MTDMNSQDRIMDIQPSAQKSASGRYELPSEMVAQQARSQRMLLLIVRCLFLVLLVAVTVLTLASESSQIEQLTPQTVLGWIIATVAVGAIVLLADAFTPNKRLTSVVGVYLGICVGLIGAVAIGALLDVIADAWELTESKGMIYLGLSKVIIGIVLCYLSVSFVLTTKDDFRLVIPYVEFAKQVRGVRPLLLDTSAIIDGRINDLGQIGFLDAPLIVPKFVIDELQQLADSSDKNKRTKGRRGLDMVSRMQSNPYLDLSIDDPQVEGLSVDKMLIELARTQNLRILTTDFNLKKVANIHDVAVLNVNDLANTLRAAVMPEETMLIKILKPGENPDQGIGYLEDGTMVVVEGADGMIGREVQVTVTNTLQTSAGRMIFARVPGTGPDTTATPPIEKTPAEQRGTSRRNPRRNG